MMQSISAAKMGIQAEQYKVDTIANNIANINTVGYKSNSVNFKDALYTSLINPVETDEDVNLEQGTGVLVASTNKSFTEGTALETGVSLDFRIEGDGFFTVESSTGEEYYTRNGAFSVSIEDGVQYLVNSSGNYILDTDLNRIEIPEDVEELSVNSSGEIYADEVYIGQFNIVTFTNRSGLSSMGNSLYAETEASGEPIASEDSTVYQGSLESSNVDLSMEMVDLIKAQRAMTMIGKALTTASEMVDLANNMR